MPDPDRYPPWSERNRPWWVPAGCAWLAQTRQWWPAGHQSLRDKGLAEKPAPQPAGCPPRYGPESEGDINSPVWGGGCGVDD